MSDTATFGWLGLSFEHPADWAPTVLSGNRTDGYVRLESSDGLALQLRWKSASLQADLNARLDAYLAKLASDANKQRQPFHRTVHQAANLFDYRWRAGSHGAGRLFYCQQHGRVVFVEAVSKKSRAASSALSRVLQTLRPGGDFELWSLHGLSARLPAGLSVTGKSFEAGRTRLALRGKASRVELDRWGFASELLRKHDLADWSRAVLPAKKLELLREEEGLRFVGNSAMGVRVEALVRPDLERNQITLLRCSFRQELWRPRWDWLVF